MQVLYNVMLLHPYLAACKIGVPGVSFSTYPGPGREGSLFLRSSQACIAPPLTGQELRCTSTRSRKQSGRQSIAKSSQSVEPEL